MAQIRLNVIKDTCLGYEVFRGSVISRDLEPAIWIDFFDETVNPKGYQRPFNEIRSLTASIYADQDDAFWPEAILAIRNNDEIEEEEDKVHFSFTPVSQGSSFGELVVGYNGARTEAIGNKVFKWRRAFSQVDCQHRLGKMADSERSITFCIIPNISRLQEALIFKTINDTQKKMGTSLVDAIIQLSQDPLDAPDVHWAFNLSVDAGSCFYKKVNMEGRNLAGQTYLITLRTLKTSIVSLVGGQRFINNNLDTLAEFDQFYILIRSYWNEVRNLWPTEFPDSRSYKLMTTPGIKGLARYGRNIFRGAYELGNNNTNLRGTITDAGIMDWNSYGTLIDASGNSGASAVFRLLTSNYGIP